jgi:hypothetical protein
MLLALALVWVPLGPPTEQPACSSLAALMNPTTKAVASPREPRELER